MQPTEIAKVLADRMRRDTTLKVYEHPDFVEVGNDVAVVIKDPDLMLNEDQVATFGTPFQRGVKMNWEVEMR